MPYSNHRSGRACAGRHAFTLIEMLIVIGIITILIVLGLSVAGKVSGTGKIEVTKQTLRVLDSALTELINSTGGANPAPWVIDPRQSNNMGMVIQPVVDGRAEPPSGEIVNSVGLFMFQCQTVPGAAAALKKLDSRFLKEYTADTTAAAFQTLPSMPTAMDAWGHPIRYVHPAFKGIIPTPPATGYVLTKSIVPQPPGKSYGILNIRRNNVNSAPSGTPPNSDSDGGINTGTRPYFYSCGPDGDPATLEDNIYLTIPRVSKN